jgi:phage shock protein A
MIFGKLWHTFKAQMNKVANYFWTADPIAQMQYEYDLNVEQMKQGREGLEQYRALVERVSRQVSNGKNQVAGLEAKVKAYLQNGDRETAGKFVLELQKAKKDLEENSGQLKMHETAYNNNLLKVKNASGKLAQLREKIQKYDADLKMSKAEAEVAKVAQAFNMDITTDFGQVEQMVQDKINLNRAKARVTADLSSEGLADIEKEQSMEKQLADQALRDFEVQMGMVTPETAKVESASKELGPATKQTVKQS